MDLSPQSYCAPISVTARLVVGMFVLIFIIAPVILRRASSIMHALSIPLLAGLLAVFAELGMTVESLPRSGGGLVTTAAGTAESQALMIVGTLIATYLALLALYRKRHDTLTLEGWDGAWLMSLVVFGLMVELGIVVLLNHPAFRAPAQMTLLIRAMWIVTGAALLIGIALLFRRRSDQVAVKPASTLTIALCALIFAIASGGLAMLAHALRDIARGGA
jgi:hypothetical protein